MFTDLSIRHVALISELSLEWKAGFQVLSGETGAGKSILIDAVNLVLGGRADRDLIQSGAERAAVEARFSARANPRLLDVLAELGIPPEEDGLILSREISASGRSVCRIGGGMAPLSALRRVSACLVDIHGQHDMQGLLDPARHIAFLDAFGGAQIEKAKAAVREGYDAYRKTRQAIERIRSDAKSRARRLDILIFQLAEIDEVRVKVGEMEKLERKRERLRNAERIGEALETAYRLTYRGTERAPSALDALRQSFEGLAGIARFDPAYETLRARLEDLYYQLEDAAMDIRGHREDAEFEPGALDAVESRLDALQKLMRKYGATEQEILDYREAMAAERAELEGGEQSAQALEKKLEGERKRLEAASEALSQRREAAAKAFTEGMLGELHDLGMEKARFLAQVTPRREEKAFSADGWDAVEFLISPNPGEPLKGLSRIASGGELSRVMLALKKIGADADDVPTLIFDEIDTGISGRMASVVGEKMLAISRSRQVLCVTHLPQIAAMGDAHYLVEKRVEGERTHTVVRPLTREERIQEIARMAGGVKITPAALEHARELVEIGEELRRKRDGQGRI